MHLQVGLGLAAKYLHLVLVEALVAAGRKGALEGEAGGGGVLCEGRRKEGVWNGCVQEARKKGNV